MTDVGDVANPYSNVLMKLALGWLLLFFAGCTSAYELNQEYFDEELKLSPLQDGRVSATFSFETILKGAAPRDPRLLNAADACMFEFLFTHKVADLIFNSSALCCFPFGPGTDTQRIRGDRVAPHVECWELELRTLGVS